MPDHDKVVAIFRELAGDPAERLRGEHFPADVCSRLGNALAEGKSGDALLAAHQVAFHLLDWQRGAAFVVALILFPEKFSDEEIREEVDMLLWDVPAHVLEAARQGGYPIENIFKDKPDPNNEKSGTDPSTSSG